MVKAYEFLEHTADVKFRACGKTLEGAFRNASYALTDVMINHKKIKERVFKKIFVGAKDKEALLYDFLEEFVVFVDRDNFLLNKIKSIKIKKVKKGYELEAWVSGDNKAQSYDVVTHIKAVTYQQMQVKKSKGMYILQVILDI